MNIAITVPELKEAETISGEESLIVFPESGNITRKASIDKVLAKEKQAREQADALLQNNINTESAERKAADNTLQGNINTLDNAAVKTTGNQTIAGEKTFSSIPILPGSNPATDNQAARKAYVDAETLERKAAIEAETTERKAKDVTLQENIDNEEYLRENADEALGKRIDSVENLGHYAGSFPTYAALPKNKSGFPNGITINDFATVQADETHSGKQTRYVASAISGNTVTWTYDLTYTTDITGKADRVKDAVKNNFAMLNEDGNLEDSGKKAADFQPALNRTITINDSTTGGVQDKGGDLSIPVGVTVPEEEDTDNLPGTDLLSLRSWLARIRANVSRLFKKLNTETEKRQEADNDLQKQINSLVPEGLENLPDMLSDLQKDINAKAPADASLDAESGAETDTSTPAVATDKLGIILQKIWGKIRQVANAKESSANKKTTVTNSDTDFPTGKAVKTQLDLKAPLANPTFTGIPKVPSKTSAAENDGTLIATEAQVYKESQLRAELNNNLTIKIASTPGFSLNTSVQAVATLTPAECSDQPPSLTVPRGVTKRYLHNLRALYNYDSNTYLIVSFQLLSTESLALTSGTLAAALRKEGYVRAQKYLAGLGYLGAGDTFSINNLIYGIAADAATGLGLALCKGNGGVISYSAGISSLTDSVIDLMA